MHCRIRTAPFIAAALALGLGTSAASAHDIGACDDPKFLTVLHPAPGKLEARAVWIDAGRIAVPADAAAPIPAGGVVKLYFAPEGGLSAAPGVPVRGAAGSVPLTRATGARAALPDRFAWLGKMDVYAVPRAWLDRVPSLLQQELLLVREDRSGRVTTATFTQAAAALDARYASAARLNDLGATVARGDTQFKLWAPTAQKVSVCLYPGPDSPAGAILPLQRNAANGAWSVRTQDDRSGSYYKYVVDVFVPNLGMVRNLVTDPYSVSLSTDSRRSYIATLSDPRLKPTGWDAHRAPQTVRAPADMTVYELHVRDFSVNDPTVPTPHRGTYAAFTDTQSNGMRHLSALAKAGLTDVHLLPVFDIGSVPEARCAVPVPTGAPDGERQQALIRQTAETDCFNWGYDPYHYNAPEGSYSTDPNDGARRIIEMREMVLALHKAGLRVGMDVVYNHTFTGGQKEKSVLDRIVPGYYHRLNAAGAIETSTCCDNTATENLMMGKLMADSVALWTREYRIDSFRFDLMGHQPRAAMEQVQKAADRAAGRRVPLIGEGWNFGEVADGKRFVQASQLSLNGSGIGTFNDRLRDAVRGGSAGDSGIDMITRQGYINGMFYDPNDRARPATRADLMRTADMVRAGLAGSIRSYPLTTYDGSIKPLEKVDYNGQPAGYASAPSEVVNYVENHDNQTLFDINVLKLPRATSGADRARVQMLGAALTAFSQGVAYFHAGVDTLRSKSLDRNSFNSGDWFNRIDWSYQDNYFGTGLPPEADNGKDYALLKPLLADASLKPWPADIAFARDAFRDLLAIRASTSLFHLKSADEIRKRLQFANVGPQQEPTVIAAWLDGRGYPGANFGGLVYLVNVDKVPHTVSVPPARGHALRLHPAHVNGADARARATQYDATTATFTVPPRTAVVFVE
ncbi:DUF3372 domain-containing protein [Massilia arenosa]|uniref:DUF3372 domain-containing protein n=1 Tax=Zemynaea arenosa TaxID=2561931 RepID=A0A4Y9S825_9BURK|nr:alpha-1,6-glucosidase domain-containing protein [Massilia arenosa]TFW17819.1 DUF3372 domain-containing protein [Massilia arenosa]